MPVLHGPPNPDAENNSNPESNFETSPLPKNENTTTKDSPLTDIGTSPPPFGLSSLDNRKHSGDSYESSELSDLGDDELEAETDKMDFLDDANPALGDKVSDLHALSELTELARLQEVDSDDLDDFVSEQLPNSPPKLNGSAETGSPGVKRELDTDDEETEQKKPKLESDQSAPEVDDGNDDDKTKETENGDAESYTGTNTAVPGELDELEPAEIAEAEKKVKAHHIAQTELATEALELTSVIEKSEDVQNGGISQSETSDAELEADADADVEADVEDVVKQEEQEEQAEQEEAEAADLAETQAGTPEGSENEQEEEELDADFDEQRKQAVEELVLIETDFAQLRDKLYHDKLALLENELQLCLDGLHPELLQIYFKVNEFYQDNIKLANLTLNYSLKCINNETVATRTAIHQNFLRDIMDMKNDMVTKTTSLWYKINRERNYLDSVVPDCNFTAIPTITDERAVFANGDYAQENSTMNKKLLKQNTLIELVNQRNKFNEQLGVLNGLTEFHGIPCGVSTELMESGHFPAEELILRRATSEEINDDLRAMGIF